MSGFIKNRKWKGKIAGPTQLGAMLDDERSDFTDSEENESDGENEIDAVEARQNEKSL